MTGQHVVVIGAGVIGTASAWYLREAGWSVTLIDKDQQGRGATSGNCGLFANSHALPLAMPGAVRDTLRALFRTRSPLCIRPRIDLRLWRWLLEFARRCNRQDMLETAVARVALIRSSRQLYRELSSEHQITGQWEDEGCLMIYKHARGLDAHAQTTTLLDQQFGIQARRLEAAELEEFEPALLPGKAAGAWFYEGDAHMRPEVLLGTWRERLIASGVEIKEGCEGRNFRVEGNQARALATNLGDIQGDSFVVATGAWTPMLEKELGVKIPIQPGKGYSLTMEQPSMIPQRPLIFEEEKVVVTPFRDAYRLGSTMEFAGYDTSLRRSRLDLLQRAAKDHLRVPLAPPLEEEWYGWRPMTFDGLPIIDRSPRIQNLMIAAGHSMLGLTMAPATAKLVMELLSGHEPHLDPSPYSIARF